MDMASKFSSPRGTAKAADESHASSGDTIAVHRLIRYGFVMWASGGKGGAPLTRYRRYNPAILPRYVVWRWIPVP